MLIKKGTIDIDIMIPAAIPKPSNPQEAAIATKKRFQERPELRKRFFEKALEQSDNKEATAIVKAAKKAAFDILRRRIDDDALAKEVANTLSLHYLAEYYRLEKEKKAEDARARNSGRFRSES